MAAAAHRVVLDTNVLVAALRSRNGASHQLLEQVQRERLLPQISVPLYLSPRRGDMESAS
jgi:predicted nucleic acid-binding protein